MREIAEFRVDEEYARLVFRDGEGKRLGSSVRKVELGTTDPRFHRVGELQRQLRHSKGRPFFNGWDLKRKYSPFELAKASLFQLKIRVRFEPAGEEVGTTYDERSACHICGAGARLGWMLKTMASLGIEPSSLTNSWEGVPSVR